MAQLAAIQNAIATGASILDSVADVYDSAMRVYGAFDGATDFSQRHRSLELCIVNGTSKDLRFYEEYFDSGTWFTSPKPLIIPPGEVSVAYVANKQGSVCTGVSGGIKYEIVGSICYMLCGFTNPHMGSYKNFVAISWSDGTAKGAYDNCYDDTVKMQTIEGFSVTCTMHEPKKSPFRMMQYTVTEA